MAFYIWGNKATFKGVLGTYARTCMCAIANTHAHTIISHFIPRMGILFTVMTTVIISTNTSNIFLFENHFSSFL